MQTQLQLAPYAAQIFDFFNTRALMILMSIWVVEVVSSIVRAVVHENFSVRDVAREVLWKPLMYLSLYVPFRLLGAEMGIPLEEAINLFSIRALNATLLNWQAIAVATNAPEQKLLDGLVKFLNIDKFNTPVK
jgi:hypothetical protein